MYLCNNTYISSQFAILKALYGVYAKDVRVRMACLNAVKCIPAVSNRSLPQNTEVATSIWIALHDPEKVCPLVLLKLTKSRLALSINLVRGEYRCLAKSVILIYWLIF